LRIRHDKCRWCDGDGIRCDGDVDEAIALLNTPQVLLGADDII
jgi:hypothetical protein